MMFKVNVFEYVVINKRFCIVLVFVRVIVGVLIYLGEKLFCKLEFWMWLSLFSVIVLYKKES